MSVCWSVKGVVYLPSVFVRASRCQCLGCISWFCSFFATSRDDAVSEDEAGCQEVGEIMICCILGLGSSPALVCLFVCRSFCLFVCRSVCRCVCLCTCVPASLFVGLSVYSSVVLSVHLSVCLPVCCSICPSGYVCHSVCL